MSTYMMIVSVVMLGIALVAQARPDFSGRWVLQDVRQSGPDTPGALSVRQTLVRTTDAGAPMSQFFKNITVEREFESDSRTETYQIGVVGGVVAGIARDGSPKGPNGHHAVTWNGDSLVLESGTYTDRDRETGTWAERREVWSLDPDGRLRIAISIRSSTAAARTVTVLYRRP